MTIYPSLEAVLITGITSAGSTVERRKRSRVCRPYSLAFYRTEDLYRLATTMCVSTTKSHATSFIVISTILTPRAGSMDNSRWDLLDVMRACYALRARKKGINWPENDDGLPSFRLEHLTKANGIEH
ncbi:hypothetical protein MJ389_18340 [Escherichia coli]|nr:hypothetical protein MJ389_18340 [Escherichia coli]